MNISDLPDDSDTSDEDYVPDNKQDLPSEVESDGDAEDDALLDSDQAVVGGKRRKKTLTKSKKKPKPEPVEEPKQEDEKSKNYDDIWADFMKDTGFKPKSSGSQATVSESKPKPQPKPQEVEQKPAKQDKVKVVQVFEFAGEEVRVEKEVAADSAEARLLNRPDDAPKSSRPVKRSGLGGISNVLSQLTKKQKISTLEKSKLDWDKFKKEENLDEELTTYNKGKDGYLEKQDFLQRADLRRFEIEKEVRAVERNKRLNNTL